MSNISQVTVAKLLGLYLRHDINFSQHVDAIVATCSQRFYLLAQLQKQGLGISSLDTTIYSKLSSSIKFGMHYQFIMDIWLRDRRVCCNECWIELLVEASLPIKYDLDVLAENAQYKLFRHSYQDATMPVSPRSQCTVVYRSSTKYRETTQVSRVSSRVGYSLYCIL